jgi:Tol biopolymer transport system component
MALMPHQAMPTLPVVSFDRRFALWASADHLLTLYNADERYTLPLDVGHAFTWSPNQSTFVYANNQAADTRLYLVRVGSDEIHAPEPIFQQTGSTTNLTWSPTTDHIAFSLRYLAEQKRTSRLEDTDVYTADLRTGEMLNLSDTRISFDTGPSWSPDGTRLAFYSAEYNQFISLVDSDGAALQRRDLVSGFIGLMTWSPNGTQLGYLTLNMMSYTSSLSVLTVEGEADGVELIPRVSHEGRFAWSPGSDQIAYIDVTDGGLMAVDVQTGHRRRLNARPGIKVILP